MWIDAGFCARALQPPLRLNFFRVRQDRLLVFVIRYHFAGGQDMHGFTTDGYRALGGAEPWLHARGNIFSGNAAAIEAGTGAYERSLEQSLARGFMGTEESALTLAIMRFPALFHVNLFLFHFTHAFDILCLARLQSSAARMGMPNYLAECFACCLITVTMLRRGFMSAGAP